MTWGGGCRCGGLSGLDPRRPTSQNAVATGQGHASPRRRGPLRGGREPLCGSRPWTACVLPGPVPPGRWSPSLALRCLFSPPLEHISLPPSPVPPSDSGHFSASHSTCVHSTSAVWVDISLYIHVLNYVILMYVFLTI